MPIQYYFLDNTSVITSQSGLENNIRELRTKRGWSQGTLADKLGVTKSTVSMWENGKTVPSSDKLPMLASLFGVTVTELLTKPIAENDTSTLRGDEVALLANYRKLNSEGKAIVQKAVRVLAESGEYEV